MKYKLFNNFKATIRNRDWWKGVLGNILSTVIGILLTIGIGAIATYRSEKKLARESMFSVVQICDENSKILVSTDSIYQSQSRAIEKILDIYYSTNKFENFKSQEQADSIPMMVKRLSLEKESRDTHADNYFNSADMLHQIGNAAVYSQFAKFVEMDRETFNKIDALYDEQVSLLIMFNTKTYVDQLPGTEVIKELIENHALSNYYFHLQYAVLPLIAQAYKLMHDRLLKAMGATEEEYQEYIESNSTDVKDSHITNKVGKKDQQAKTSNETKKENK